MSEQEHVILHDFGSAPLTSSVTFEWRKIPYTGLLVDLIIAVPGKLTSVENAGLTGIALAPAFEMHNVLSFELSHNNRRYSMVGSQQLVVGGSTLPFSPFARRPRLNWAVVAGDTLSIRILNAADADVSVSPTLVLALSGKGKR